MKFVTYLSDQPNRASTERVGILATNSQGNFVIDVLDGLEWLSAYFSSSASKGKAAALNQNSSQYLECIRHCDDVLSIIRNQDKTLPLLRKLLEVWQTEISPELNHPGFPKSLCQSEVVTRLLSPIPRPVSMRDGYAFRQHVEAARRNRGLPMIPEFDEFPVFYFTNHLAVTGPGNVPVQKQARNQLDFELEVAVVIGKEGRNIKATDADEHIFGYMILNDWSARALQMQEMKLNLGPAKGKDFGNSLGPYLVTRDELKSHAIPSPQGERHNLGMKAWVNGDLLSQGNLKDIHWTFAQIIERASYGVTLFPGEVIGSGTVGTGCLLELNGSKVTDNLWLKPGDTVAIEVEGLGKLVNHITTPDPDI